MALSDIPRTLWWEDGSVRLIDQSRLPLSAETIGCDTYECVCQAITTMAVRGAPALGVAAAMAVALWVANQSSEIVETDVFLAELDRVAGEVTATRPTAVNLFWGAERIKRLACDNAYLPLPELRDLLVTEAQAMAAEDEERNRSIGANGAALLPRGARVLTHCNAGSLCAAFFGTALGVIFSAHEQGKIAQVWVDETRPVLQGARLTAWELKTAGVPFRLITDNMAASVMRAGLVDAVVVGADRIASNGDVANKIGTYGLAVLCKEHGIPFYVAAPTSTVDLTLESGEGIRIEERDPREVEGVAFSGPLQPRTSGETGALETLTAHGEWELPIENGHRVAIVRRGEHFAVEGWVRIAPPDIDVYNPSFDVTPSRYVTAIVTECGVAQAPYADSLRQVCKGSGAIHEL